MNAYVINKKRHDIQYLRALSVSGVVLYHLFANRFATGFLGVDIFFVISGFVMSRSIFRLTSMSDFREFNIGFKEFLFSRYLRLAPALGMTISIFIPLCIIWGDERDLARIIAQSTSALFGLGNFLAYFLSTDYFHARQNPFVHTWSLSVEEQFYFFTPLLIFILRKSRKLRASNRILIFCIMSVSLIIYISMKFSNNELLDIGDVEGFIFYSPLTRAWEFALGLLLAHSKYKSKGAEFENKIKYVIFAALAFTLSCNQLLTLNSFYLLLFTMILTSAYLLMAPNLNFSHFPGRVIERVGDASYSIYLVHMPIIYLVFEAPFFKFYFSEKILLTSSLISIFLLGFGIHFRIESRFRLKPHEKSSIRQHKSAVILATCVPLLILAICTLAVNVGIFGDFKGAKIIEMQRKHMAQAMGCVDENKAPGKCVLVSGTSGISALLIGDSQADAISDGISTAAKELNISLWASARSGCAFVLMKDQDPNCEIWREKMADYISLKKFDLLVIANRSNGYQGMKKKEYFHELHKTLEKFQKKMRILIVDNIPEPRSEYWRTNYGGIKLLNVENQNFMITSEKGIMVSTVSSNLPNITVFDPKKFLCNSSKCMLVVRGKILYLDAWHLSVYGSEFLEMELQRSIEKILKII